MTVPEPREQPPTADSSNDMGENGASKLAKATSTRSLLSISYRELSSSQSSRGVPPRTADVSDALDQWIKGLGGDRALHSVLVANNGLAAVKFIRSVRSWAYKTFGNERAVKLIAMATSDDMQADAEHIRMADQFVEVPGGKNVNNYANVGLITSVAVRTGVDAVWPGWGHASEFPELPEALGETFTGIRFVGPPAGPMAALGDKVGSTILAQAAGVPTLAWSGTGVAIAYGDCPGGEIPRDIYARACIESAEDAVGRCDAIGYPVMLKASWGGGGKGIRRVLRGDEVRRAYEAVRGEVPGSPVFAMKLAPRARHLEVQLLCDAHGAVCSLFSRDCSVQRRHQKIVEEGPVTAAPEAVTRDMERCARALARSVGYVGAATVEYLYLIETGEYCFLELNPRLQVEHPVTEMISGVNIPAAQLLIAAGVPLHRIPDVRRLFKADPAGEGEIDFETTHRLPPSGHVVAVRITAENAYDGFKPTCGSIDEVSFRSTPDVWGYFSVKPGGRVHEYADSQFGHLFARGETREAAIRAMVVALKDIKIRGEIHTPVDYVVDLIQDPEFLEDKHHTGWLDGRIAAMQAGGGAGAPAWHLAVVAGAVLRASRRCDRRAADFLACLQRGQLPPDRVNLVRLQESFVLDGMKYTVDVVRTGPQGYRLSLGGGAVDAIARPLQDGGLLLQLDGQSHVLHAEEEALGTRITLGSRGFLLSTEHDPSRLLAPSTGKLVRHLVDDGGRVAAGEAYAEIEVMKMMMSLAAPSAGVLTWEVTEGAVLTPGMLLARLELDDLGAVRRAEPFSGSFPPLGPPTPDFDGLGARFRGTLDAAHNVMAGYAGDVAGITASLLAALDDPALALVQWDEAYAAVAGRLPGTLATRLEAILGEGLVELAGAGPSHAGVGVAETLIVAGRTPAERAAAVIYGDDPDSPRVSAGAARGNSGVIRRVTPATRCTARLQEALIAALASETDGGSRAALRTLVDPLLTITRAHAGGPEGYARSVALALLEAYLRVEEAFETGGVPGTTPQEVIDSLRTSLPDDPGAVLAMVLAHQSGEPRASLACRLLNALALPAPDGYRPVLRRLAALSGAAAQGPARRAQLLLEHSLLGELRGLAARALSGLDMFSEAELRDGMMPVASPLHGGAVESSMDNNDDGIPRLADAVAALPDPTTTAALTSPRSPLVSRRTTLVEGLYEGLGNLHAAAAPDVDTRMAMLVEAAAAVEDALASLLDHPDPVLQRRALATYARRLYFPAMLHEPEIVGIGPRGALAAVWAHACRIPMLREGVPVGTGASSDGSSTANDTLPRYYGAALVIPSLADLPAALADVQRLKARTGMAGLAQGTLHVVLTAEGREALRLGAGAEAAMGTIDTAEFCAAALAAASEQGGGLDEDNDDGKSGDACADATVVAASVAAQTAALGAELRAAGVMAICYLARHAGLGPLRVTLYANDDGSVDGNDKPVNDNKSKLPGSSFTLDPVLGCVEPPTAGALELERLRGRRGATHATSRNRQWHVWTLHERAGARSAQLCRAFLRGAVRGLGRPALLAAGYAGNAPGVAAAALAELEPALVAAASELDRWGKGRVGAARPDWAHVFLSVLAPLPLGGGEAGSREEAAVAAALAGTTASMAGRHAALLRRAAVAGWELRLAAAGAEPAWRVIVSAPTGHEAGEECVEVYREDVGCSGGCTTVLRPVRVGGQSGGVSAAPALPAPALAPYPALEPLQQRRLTARRHRTTFAYDFPAVFDDALRAAWAARAAEAGGRPSAAPPAGRLVTAEELVIPEAELRGYAGNSARIRITDRPPSRNDIGIVAWLLTLRTPECPAGRQVVAIVNDITFNSGSFGPREDAFFKAATEYALALRLPVLYLAANSGARVGLAEEVKRCLQVEWSTPEDPSRGVRYLFLSEEDYSSITARATAETGPPLRCTTVTAADGSKRYVLEDVIGLEDGLGVECLSGSGAIAGTYARAFREGFTLTLVSGRSVGIGAYLARLGRRCIQRREQPLILTGFAALNKLLGREVYTSHAQLGGPRVMGSNGVSHHVVEDDLAGVATALQWLAFVPARLGEPAPVLEPVDPVDRPVTYAPPEGEKMDARLAIAGGGLAVAADEPHGVAAATVVAAGASASGQLPTKKDAENIFPLTGLFDAGSWVEAQAGWARTVITGRARLGGVPCGVIGVETGTVQLSLPADPGQPDSSERVIPQAGQVWYPDSALKTAQAIEEFGLEGLPLFILANWRGFSGGQRDLFEGVLQAGSQIVEMLRTYKQPVTVYLGPGCELRGGAWVVVDSQINPLAIEMYADPTAQGAVLEPQGVVEIKFRDAELVRAMHRLDPRISAIRAAGGAAAAAEIRAREMELLPVYRQVAEQFAQMHDGPERMLAKNVVRGILPWADSRRFLAARLRRRLAERALAAQVTAADGSLDSSHATEAVKAWYTSSIGAGPGGAVGPVTAIAGPASPSAIALGLDTPARQLARLQPARDASEAAWRDDSLFLAWAESELGASRVALELKNLRAAAAQRGVAELCQTQEGTAGLVKGLAAALCSNPSLLLQLRSLTSES